MWLLAHIFLLGGTVNATSNRGPPFSCGCTCRIAAHRAPRTPLVLLSAWPIVDHCCCGVTDMTRSLTVKTLKGEVFRIDVAEESVVRTTHGFLVYCGLFLHRLLRAADPAALLLASTTLANSSLFTHTDRVCRCKDGRVHFATLMLPSAHRLWIFFILHVWVFC